MVGGSYYVLTGSVDYAPLLISTPIGLLVALVLLENNLRDVEYDREVGVDTIVKSKGQGLNLCKGLLFIIFASTIPLVAARLLTPSASSPSTPSLRPKGSWTSSAARATGCSGSQGGTATSASSPLGAGSGTEKSRQRSSRQLRRQADPERSSS